MRTTIILLIIFSLMGCTDTADGRRSPSKPVDITAKVEVNNAYPQSCSCQNAKQILITNTDSRRGYVPTILYEHEIQNDVFTSLTETFLLEPGESKTLDCTIDKPAGAPNCLITRTYEINGVQWPDKIQSVTRDHVVQIVQGNLAGNSDINPHGQCANRCVHSTGQCYVIPGGSDSDLGIKIANVISSSDLNDGIPVSTIMALTASGKNECNRTDVALRNGNGFNYGDNCIIKGTLPATLGTVNMEVKPNFLFEISRGVGVNNFSIDFSKSAGAINVEFTDSTLNANYGGVVKKINYQNKMYAVETNNGSCVAIELK